MFYSDKCSIKCSVQRPLRCSIDGSGPWQVNLQPGETLSYQWSLVSAPRGTNLKTNSSLNVNNNQATTASFVPDTAGTYSFEFTAADGCNPVVKRLLTIQVRD